MYFQRNYMSNSKNLLKNINKINSLFKSIPKKGYKMQQLHFYTGASHCTPSGIKACIFGATSSMGFKIAGNLMERGVPTVMSHRNPFDVFLPMQHDLMSTNSSPFLSFPQFIAGFDGANGGLQRTRCMSDLGMRYYQVSEDLTNEYDIELAIKDCDVVFNCIGEKPINKHDIHYEEPNVIIPREIAKVCARKKKEGKLKRFIHFSAAGCGPEAISRRLRTKWQGEQEVKKYFPEATIIRPTTILSYNNHNNFVDYYIHFWNHNNGTVILVDEGKCLRQPVLDNDIVLATWNILQLNDSIGQTYELGGLNKYTMRELIEFFSNQLRHRPKFISYTYEDFMKTFLGPNFNFEKGLHWKIFRPDYSCELREDIVVNKQNGVKTFEDLFITPVSTHHTLTDWSNWFFERLNIENKDMRDHDEFDGDDDGHY